MNITSATTVLTVLMAVSALPLQAQNTSFLIGQGQPQNPAGTPAPIQSRNPVQGMTTPPIQPMINSPILPLGGGIVPQQQAPRGTATYSNNAVVSNNVLVLGPGDTIFVPVGTMVVENGAGYAPGSYVAVPQAPGVPAAPATPSGNRGGNVQIQRPSRTPNSPSEAPDSKKNDNSRLEVGTPREKVIEKYGNPVAYMLNMNGETLYFNNGVVEFIQNGVVATPGK